MEIKNNVFIVSGGASGLGRATAEMIVKNHGKVIIFDLNKELGEKTEKDLGENARFFPVNICLENSVLKALENVSKVHGIINCAGVGTPGRAVGKEGPLALENFSKVVEINLIGTFNLIRLGVNIMQNMEMDDNGERGIVINTASMAAFDGQIGQAAYSASKGGVVAMTLPLAREFSRMGIRVNTIAPGLFDTPMGDKLSPEYKESLIGQTLFPRRFGRPEEYANLVKTIIENPMLNAETIRLDGGTRMQAK